MPLQDVQITGLNLWHGIQTGKMDEVEGSIYKNFEGTFVGVMNGQRSVVKVDARQFVAMCQVTGEAVNGIGSLDFKFGTAKWGKNDKDVYVIEYSQVLAFTPTPMPPNASDAPQELSGASEAIPLPLEAESAAPQQESQDSSEKNLKMLSTGFQVIQWVKDGNNAIITKMWGCEKDEVSEFEQSSVRETIKKKLHDVVMLTPQALAETGRDAGDKSNEEQQQKGRSCVIS